MGHVPSLSRLSNTHFGQVKKIRMLLPNISKEDFRKLSKDPLVKELLRSQESLTEDQIKDRINIILSEI